MTTARLDENNIYEGDIAAGTTFRFTDEGKLTIIGNIGRDAVIDCRKCELVVQGNRGDDVTFYSLGKPTITGEKGRNVTYFIYDATGKSRLEKIGMEGDLVVGGNRSVNINGSLSAADIRRLLGQSSLESSRAPKSTTKEVKPVIKESADRVEKKEELKPAAKDLKPVTLDKEKDLVKELEKDDQPKFELFFPTHLQNGIRSTAIGGKTTLSGSSTLIINSGDGRGPVTFRGPGAKTS